MLSAKQGGAGLIALAGVILVLTGGCATHQPQEERTTSRDKTKKGAGIGAAAGAVLGAVLGEGEADEILAGAAIGAGIGAGIGGYMDRQEEALGKIPGTRVERVGEDTLLIYFDSDILFDVDSSVLSSEARSSLDQVGSVLVDYPKTAVIVQGHTDATGSEVHNLSLSERRAAAVKNHLVGRGVEPDRMVAVGYGESEPVAGNETRSGRQMNRRVNILLKAKAR
jgi:outer membrane protein OmpA-like peptidoglycan-associated protein